MYTKYMCLCISTRLFNSVMLFFFPFRFCKRNTLDTSIIQGQVVVCLMETPDDDYSEKSSVVRSGGGVGMIVVDPYDEKDHPYFDFPTSVINQDEANNLRNYMASTRLAITFKKWRHYICHIFFFWNGYLIVLKKSLGKEGRLAPRG